MFKMEISGQRNFIADSKAFICSNWKQLVILSCVYLLVNTLYYFLNDIANIVSVSHLFGDSIFYNSYAVSFMHHPHVNINVDRLPGFVSWLGVLYMLFGKSNFGALFIANVLLSGFVGVALYCFTCHFLKNKVIASTAFLLYAVNPIILYYNFMVLSEPFTTFMVLYTFVFFYLTLRYRSLFFFLLTSAFYIIGFHSKFFLFFTFPLCYIFCAFFFLNKKQLCCLGLMVLSLFFVYFILKQKIFIAENIILNNGYFLHDVSRLMLVLSIITCGIVLLIVTKRLLSVKYKRLFVFFLFVVTLFVGVVLYQIKIIYVNNIMHYKTFSTLSEHTINGYWVPSVLYYQYGYYKDNRAWSRDAAKKFEKHYWDLRLKQKNPRAAKIYRLDFAIKNARGVLMGATDGVLATLFIPLPNLYVYHNSGRFKVGDLPLEKLQDVFYIMRHLDNASVGWFFAKWIGNILLFCIALFFLARNEKIKIWHIIAVMFFVFLSGPVQGVFSAVGGSSYRYRFIVVPFLAFMYSAALWSIYEIIISRKVKVIKRRKYG